MKRPRRLRLKIALALLLLAVAAFPYGWGPAIAGCVARSYLDLEEPGSSELRVECVTPFRLRASGHPITDDEIKSIIHPKYGDDEVVKRAELWKKMTNST